MITSSGGQRARHRKERLFGRAIDALANLSGGHLESLGRELVPYCKHYADQPWRPLGTDLPELRSRLFWLTTMQKTQQEQKSERDGCELSGAV